MRFSSSSVQCLQSLLRHFGVLRRQHARHADAADDAAAGEDREAALERRHARHGEEAQALAAGGDAVLEYLGRAAEVDRGARLAGGDGAARVLRAIELGEGHQVGRRVDHRDADRPAFAQRLRLGRGQHPARVLERERRTVRRRVFHSTLMFPSRMTLPTLATSALTKAANSSGVEAFGTEPRLVMRSRTSGAASTFATSRDNWFTICGGVFAGANRPYHWSQSSGTPASASVGTSGSDGTRALVLTASATRRPSFTMPSALQSGANEVCTRPVAVSVITSGTPL